MSRDKTENGRRLTVGGARYPAQIGHAYLMTAISPSLRGLGGGLLLCIFLLLTPHLSQAHESRPLFVEITETSSGVYELQYKIPSSVPDFNLPLISLPENFKELDKVSLYRTNDGFLKKQTFQGEALNGAAISITYPVMNPSVSTIVRVQLLNGEVHNRLLGPNEMQWVVPDQETRRGVAREYTVLGIQHILEGWDHLLFLVCLIFVAGIGRKMLITITGFTIAHSLTLALAALNVVNVPVPPVEAVIALSVVFLATEIAINNRKSLTFRYPIAVSSSFGLLHGFGFASVLSDIGLPQTQIPVSLLFFNIGVELGQIMFLLAVIVFYKIYLALKKATNSSGLEQIGKFRFETMAAYVVGVIASYWMIERVVGFF